MQKTVTKKKRLGIYMLLLLIYCLLFVSIASCNRLQDGIYYELDSGTDSYVITNVKSDNNYEGELIIPSTYKDKPVTKISDRAFMWWEKLTSITIPASIIDIGDRALSTLSLQEIIVSEDNEYYKSVDGVLYNKTMSELICYPSNKTEESFIVPNSVENIIPYAFVSNSNLKSIILNDQIQSIGDDAFLRSGLNNLFIPQSVVSMGNNIVQYCTIDKLYIEANAIPNTWESNWNIEDQEIALNSKRIIFDSKGGTLLPELMGESGSIIDTNIIPINEKRPLKEGYTFNGWWTSNDGGDTLLEEYDFTINNTLPETSLTLYAKWSEIE